MLLAEHLSVLLLNPVAPVLMVLTFLPWAWLVSSRLEKDARYFYLNWRMWNGIHLGAGLAALAAMLFIPIFWIGWPVGILLLGAPVLVYWNVRNRSVPEEQQYHLTSEGLKERMEARRSAKAARDAVLTFTSPDGETRPIPDKETPLYAVHMLVEDLVGPALEQRASAVELVVTKNGAASAQTVDGIKYKREPMAADDGLKAIDYLKAMAGLDVEDKRRRQRSVFRVNGPLGRTEITLVTAGSSNGVQMRAEFDRVKQLQISFDQLGLLEPQKKLLEDLVEPENRHGIVLMGAPAGQGLRTSVLAQIGRHDAYTSNIKSLEREIERHIDGVDHVQFDAANPDADYATQLQSILRRDPDVVQAGFCLDPETARVIIHPGMEGPLLFVPMRAASTDEMIRQWVKLVGDTKDAVRSLRVVMNQRLVRKLCENCRQPYQPSPEQLSKLNLGGKVTQLFRANGKIQVKNKIENCPICQGLGYMGQTGVFEVMPVDREMRKLLAAGDLAGAKAHARRSKMLYLQEAALTKVVSGETSLEEVARISAPPKSRGGSAPKQPAPAGA